MKRDCFSTFILALLSFVAIPAAAQDALVGHWKLSR